MMMMIMMLRGSNSLSPHTLPLALGCLLDPQAAPVLCLITFYAPWFSSSCGDMTSSSSSSTHTTPPPASTCAADKLSALMLLPSTVLSLTSSLSSDDQEVLSYLVGVATRIHDTPAAALPSDASKSLRKSVAGKPDSCSTSKAGVHQPTFDCDCFDCYSNFWSRWNASAQRDVIDSILDLLDHHLHEGHSCWRAAVGPQVCRSTEGKKKHDKMKAVEAALSGKEQTASRRGKLSWKKQARGERIRAGKTKLQTLVGGTMAQASVALTGTKNVRAVEGDGKTISNSLPSDSLLSQDVLPGVLVDAHPSSTNSFHTINGSKQLGGKRRSKQVAPLDSDGVHVDVQEEEEEVVASRSEGATVGSSPVALRVENSSFRGRGFLGRVFPDALGGVATRLWDLVSLRLRNHTTDFY